MTSIASTSTPATSTTEAARPAQPKPMTAFWAFVRMMFRFKWLMVASFVAAMVDALCAFAGFSTLMWMIDQLFKEQNTVQQLASKKLASPQLTAWIGDQTQLADWIPAGRFEGFAALLGIMLVLVVIGSAARFVQSSAVFAVALRTIARIRQRAFSRLIHTPIELIVAQGSADYTSRIQRDTGALVRGFNALLGKAVRDVLLGTAMLSVALILDWKLTGFFMIALPVIGLLVAKFGRKLRRAMKYAMRSYGGMIQAMTESLQGLRVVKVHGGEGYERRRFTQINREVLRQEMRARILRALSSPMIEMVAIIAVMGVALFATYYAFQPDGPDPDEVAKVLMMLALAGMTFQPLAKLNNNLAEASAAASRLRELFDLPVERHPRHGQRHLIRAPRHQKSIRFERVSYRYPNASAQALDEINLHVEFGQSVAVVGPNGSGKSTLLAMVPGLLEPRAGRLCIDEVDVAGMSLRSLRKQIAVVTQDTVLFAGTIASNIAYGQRQVSIERIEAAARTANAMEFIGELPEGLQTELAEGGEGLSGGQKQRICIARAVLRDPTILILDEATSQIDADSEAKINQALSQLRHGRTVMVIAHRLSTVLHADKIVVMDQGRIVDAGTHEQLLDRCAVYRTLTQTQLAGRA